MRLIDAYYYVKPLIPRFLQIALRRKRISWKRSSCIHVWPINEEATDRPKGWPGWPQGKRFAFILTHDVEGSLGVQKCLPLMELEKSMGFRSSFNFVPEQYAVPPEIRKSLSSNGCEIGIHGITHSGDLFRSRKVFEKQAEKINRYLSEWGASGFRSPSMYHNLEWIHELNVEYDASTFDTDPFEPQPDGIGTVFPLWISGLGAEKGYVELPYTLPQDFTLFVLMREKSIDIWKKKLDWIVEQGGMALLITHPDYMNFNGGKLRCGEYPARYYLEFLEHVQSLYAGQYWHALPKELARFWAQRFIHDEPLGHRLESFGPF